MEKKKKDAKIKSTSKVRKPATQPAGASDELGMDDLERVSGGVGKNPVYL